MDDEKYAFREALKERTKQFALRIIRLSESLPKSRESDVIGRQILRAGTSVAANYRAACCARSLSEFRSKISIVVEECDETVFWIELLIEANLIPAEKLLPLKQEALELLYIMSSARKNTRKNNTLNH